MDTVTRLDCIADIMAILFTAAMDTVIQDWVTGCTVNEGFDHFIKWYLMIRYWWTKGLIAALSQVSKGISSQLISSQETVYSHSLLFHDVQLLSLFIHPNAFCLRTVFPLLVFV